MNTQKVVYLSLAKAKKAIVLCILAQKYMPKYDGGQEEKFGAILWGQSGIGKNGITNNLGVELTKVTGQKYRQVDVNLAGMSPEDIHGVPAIREEVLKYFTSLNFDKDEVGIFRLDEIDRPAYFQTLIEMAKYAIDRTDHRHVLPFGMFVLGMGNGSSDSNTQELSEHLKGRFCHLYVSENVAGAHDEHLAYMRKAGMSDSLLRLVEANPIVTRDEFEESAVFHKRSLSFANAILMAYKDLKKTGADFGDVLLACLSGVVTKNMALEIIRYEEMAHLPTLEEVCAAPMNAELPEDISLRHRYVTMLVNDARLRCDLGAKLIDYLMRCQNEMARYGIDKLVLDCPEIVKTSQYIKWTKVK